MELVSPLAILAVCSSQLGWLEPAHMIIGEIGALVCGVVWCGVVWHDIIFRVVTWRARTGHDYVLAFPFFFLSQACY